MRYLIVLSMCILASTKVNIQSLFAKAKIKTSADALWFNALVFSFTSLMFIPAIFQCELNVWIYSAFFAVLTVIFQIFYSLALSKGFVSITVMLVNLSMVIPVLFSVIVYGESLSVAQIIAIFLIVVVFLNVDRVHSNKSSSKSDFIFAIIAMLANGALAITQKMFAHSKYASDKAAFVSASYICAAVIAFTVYYIFSKSGYSKTYKSDNKTFLLAIGTGLVLALFQRINTHAIENVSAAFLFPAYSGGSMILSTISGVLIFKDTLTKKQKINLIAGITSIILINF